MRRFKDGLQAVGIGLVLIVIAGFLVVTAMLRRLS